jgi:type II secretory pathway pseudopilin PulG
MKAVVWFTGGVLVGAALISTWAGKQQRAAQEREATLRGAMQQLAAHLATVQSELRAIHEREAEIQVWVEEQSKNLQASNEAYRKSLPIDQQIHLALQSALYSVDPIDENSAETPPKEDDHDET